MHLFARAKPLRQRRAGILFFVCAKDIAASPLNCGDCCGIAFAPDSAARNPSGAAARLTGERPQQIEAIFCSTFSPQSAKNFARFVFFARLRFHPPCICSRGLNLCAKGAREFCFSYAQKILSPPSLNCGDCCGITFAPDRAARNPSGAAARLTGERPQQIEAIFCSTFSPQGAKNFARFTFLRVLRSFSSLCEEVFAPSNSAGVAAALAVL